MDRLKRSPEAGEEGAHAVAQWERDHEARRDDKNAIPIGGRPAAEQTD